MTRQEAFTPEERELIESDASRARLLDRELSRLLDHPEPGGKTVSGRFLDELGSRPLLSRPIERELIARARAGDPVARGQLLEAHLPLIASVARTYRSSRRVERLELLQEGAVGLLRALERYDPDRGTPFWAYASWWVRQAMQQLVAELTGPVVLSDRALRQLAQLKHAHGEHVHEQGVEPTLDELAERSGLEEDQIQNLLAAGQTPRSLEEPAIGAEGEIGMFGDVLADPLAEDEYERVLAKIEIEELSDLLGALTERERDILAARFGLGRAAESLRDIGGRLGMSAERVRQLEQRALAKLRIAAERGPGNATPAG